MARTLFYVLVAVGLIAAAWFTSPSGRTLALYDDSGEYFFPDFGMSENDETPDVASALTVTSALQVSEYDAETASLDRFRVENRGGKWSIPSHYDYPADANTRMSQAAGLLIGLQKENVVSDDPADHALYGVLDPEDEAQHLEDEGHGQRITFEDSSGNQLASLIVGKKVEDRTQFNYVRDPSNNQVYTAKLPNEIDTTFAEWIETDLTQVESFKIEKLSFDNYSVDEVAMREVAGDRIIATKEDGAWVVEGLAETEETEVSPLSTAATTLDQLKIVGVRKKPDGLADGLSQGQFTLDQESAMSLMGRGFFPTQTSLLANEGEMSAYTEEGVVYRLWFGEVLFGTGDDVTRGSENEGKASDEPATDDETDGEDDSESDGNNRFLMITVSFDETMLDQPEEEALPQEELDKRRAARNTIESLVSALEDYRADHEDALPDSLEVLTQVPEGKEAAYLESLDADPWGNAFTMRLEDEGEYAIVSFGADGQESGLGVNQDVSSRALDIEDELQSVAGRWATFEEDKELGLKKVSDLAKRFAPWYYVIDNASFDKLHLQRADVVKEKEAAENEGDSEGSLDGGLPFDPNDLDIEGLLNPPDGGGEDESADGASDEATADASGESAGEDESGTESGEGGGSEEEATGGTESGEGGGEEGGSSGDESEGGGLNA